MRYSLAFALMIALSSPPALAQDAAVNSNGDIRISGQVSTITRDSFIITHGSGSSEVMFSSMSDKTVSRLRDTDILQDGSYVTVEGRLKDGPLGRGVVEARDIYVQAPTNSAE